MAGSGYVKLWRDVIEHPVFAHDGLFRLWCYCLVRANWKDVTWMIPGTLTPINIPRGAFVTGRKSLHAALYPKHDRRELPTPADTTLWNWLKTLDRLGCVKLKTIDNRCTLVSVCNYSTYQDVQDEILPADCPPADRFLTGGCPPVDTTKALKSIKAFKKDKKEESLPLPPPCLQTEQFAAAWKDWQQHRKEKREPITPTMAAAQLAKLAEMGHDRAVACIRHTLFKGWQGLREEANRGSNGKPRTGPGQTYDPDAAKKDPNHGRM